MSQFNVRAYDPTTETFFTRVVDIETVIREPYMMHINDIGIIALNELRRLRGLEPLPANTIAEESIHG